MQLAAFHLDSSDWEDWGGGGILFAADGLCLCKTLPFLEHLLLYQDNPWCRGFMPVHSVSLATNRYSIAVRKCL